MGGGKLKKIAPFKSIMFCYDYPRPAVTVDIVVFSSDALEVLLIQRKHPPFEGHWALPGGFIEMEEPLETSARRELEEETGITDVTLTEVGTFGAPSRDPRGRVITIAYTTVIEKSTVNVKAGSDASEAAWFLNTELPELAFDHTEIIQKALERIK